MSLRPLDGVQPIPVFPVVWVSARGVRALLALALGLALATFLPPLLPAVLAGFVVAVALVAVDAVVGPSPRALRIARDPLPPLALGRSAQVTYALENRTPFAVRVAVLEPPLAKLAFGLDEMVASIAPRSRTTAHITIEPRERGAVTLGPLYGWSENRIGLLRRRFCVEGHDEARVLPDLRGVEAVGSVAIRQTLLETGLRRLRERGVGTEFESLREYGPGDPFRNIDWKASARRGRTLVTQYEVERSQNVILVLDCGRVMAPYAHAVDAAPDAADDPDRHGGLSKLDYALIAALSVARIAQRADDNVGVAAFAAQPLCDIAPRRGAGHYRKLVQALYDVQPRREDVDYEVQFAALRRRYPKRSLIVVFTDIFDATTSAAALAGLSLLVPRHLVVCVLMNDATVADALDTVPQTPHDAFRTVVAMRLADERAKAIAALRGRGILAIDVPAAKLTVASIDAYLDIKARGQL